MSRIGSLIGSQMPPMNDSLWIWQQPNWPHFSWQAEALAPLLRVCSQAQGRLLGMLGAVGSDTEVHSSLDAMLQNIVTSSAIEGEQLNVGSVRSSLARRLGLNEEGRTTSRSEGLAELLLDATHAHQQPLDEQRLFTWHRWLFPSDDQLLARPLHIGTLRGEEPMQVVSGRIDRPTVHFEAPRAWLVSQLADFLAWFESSRSDASLDPFLRAGIAHFWFVTLPTSMTATAASRAPLPTRHWLRASSRLFASMPCPRASLMITLVITASLKLARKVPWTSPPGCSGFSEHRLITWSKPLLVSTVCRSRRASGRHTAAKRYRRSRSKCLTACSMAASAVSRTVSARRSTKPWPRYPKLPQPVI